jgi:hypothetical protein
MALPAIWSLALCGAPDLPDASTEKNHDSWNERVFDVLTNTEPPGLTYYPEYPRITGRAKEELEFAITNLTEVIRSSRAAL